MHTSFFRRLEAQVPQWKHDHHSSHHMTSATSRPNLKNLIEAAVYFAVGINPIRQPKPKET